MFRRFTHRSRGPRNGGSFGTWNMKVGIKKKLVLSHVNERMQHTCKIERLLTVLRELFGER